MTFSQLENYHARRIATTTTTTTTSSGSNNNSSSGRGRRIRHFFHFGKKKVEQPEQPAFDTIGGVYCNDTVSFASTSDSKTSFRTIDTQETTFSHDSSSQHSSDSSSTPPPPTSNGCWISSGCPGHHEGAPLVAERRAAPGNAGRRRGLLVVPETNDDEDEDDECVFDQEKALGEIMLRARQELPTKDSWYHVSNHIMINSERTKRMIAPLVRETTLDSLARAQAAAMASSHRLYYSDLQLGILEEPSAVRRLGENVTRGPTLEDIHDAMMVRAISTADRNNILDRRFTHMGMGTAKASDGTLYLCQLFRG